MLAGQVATQICFPLTTSFTGLLPSDPDGTTPPLPGAPNMLLSLGTDSLNAWQFHVDFVVPTNSTFVGPMSIPVPPFFPGCPRDQGTCVPQIGTSNKLDGLGQSLMFRVAYRNFGTFQSWVATHSVSLTKTDGTVVAARWYELRAVPAGTPSLFQQGTYAPDSTYRWNGSIAMDKVGDIALGYSVSSGAIHPGIRFTARNPTDLPGTFQAENSIIEGTGSQLKIASWGRYSALTVDPVDDCTFYYTNEYLKVDGTLAWSTRIASFRLPVCV